MGISFYNLGVDKAILTWHKPWSLTKICLKNSNTIHGKKKKHKAKIGENIATYHKELISSI